MKAEEAIAGFQELSRKFRQGYKWGELEGIWPELLQCSPQAMVRAVGIMIKNCHRRPEPAYVLEKVLWWNMNLQPQVSYEERKVSARRDPDEEAREALSLMKSHLHGDIDYKTAAARLFAMSERYGKPGYAMQAKDLLAANGN
jgi:hypothetical protein